MSNFVVAVGGSGAKLMQTLVHLTAAGLLPAHRRELFGLLVDPDENNGNVEECLELFKAYEQCRTQLGTQMGATDFLSGALRLEGPYTPLRDGRVDTLKEIFQYDKLERAGSIDAELLDLFYEAPELEMSIKQGFRGRPSIGATVLAEAVSFARSPWSDLKERIKGRGTQGAVHVLLAGSVFGGSGAAGVPTLVRLLGAELSSQLPTLRLGLALFLPFFQFKPVPGEDIQADPAAFPTATAEALKYYHERGFLEFCHSIYCVGEEVPADVAIAAIGAAEQRNEAHFVELIAGVGAMRFFNDQVSARESSLAVAGRNEDSTLTWDDLPYDEYGGSALVRKLQQMALFAVSYRYLFFPVIADALSSQGKSHQTFWVTHIEDQKRVNKEEVGRALRDLNDYVARFLTWLLRVSTPRRENFTPGMVNPTVFAVRDGNEWRLKLTREFNDSDFSRLLLNQASRTRLDSRSVFERAARKVDDQHATAAGRVVRAIYDACKVE